MMPHNLCIVDYGLGHPGSVHDAYTFTEMYLANDPEGLILRDHWIWADSAHPMHLWCVVPFKSTKTTPLSRGKNLYNKYLLKVRLHTCEQPANQHLIY
jgi:hypothetical protein